MSHALIHSSAASDSPLHCKTQDSYIRAFSLMDSDLSKSIQNVSVWQSYPKQRSHSHYTIVTFASHTTFTIVPHNSHILFARQSHLSYTPSVSPQSNNLRATLFAFRMYFDYVFAGEWSSHLACEGCMQGHSCACSFANVQAWRDPWFCERIMMLVCTPTFVCIRASDHCLSSCTNTPVKVFCHPISSQTHQLQHIIASLNANSRKSKPAISRSKQFHDQCKYC